MKIISKSVIYRAARPALFRLDAETAHHLTLASLAHGAGLARHIYARSIPPAPRTVMGLSFPNPVGLAAGLDKDGACIDGLAALGFGFIEVGTITPRAQPGNPKPRMFRLVGERALINRLGFNNQGVEHLLRQLQRSRFAQSEHGVLGINIGKNFDTPLDSAHEDYLFCMRKVYPHADYITINISSPNTKGLRGLQDEPALTALLALLKEEQARLADAHGKYVPLVVKIAPDLDESALTGIAAIVARSQMDGVIATNTTITRPGLDGVSQAEEQGGLSGAPLNQMSTAAVRILARALDGAAPIIAVGGVMEGADAHKKIEAGAALVQIYTGLIYRGPSLVGECVKAIGGEAGA